jgi:hypothetical protein
MWSDSLWTFYPMGKSPSLSSGWLGPRPGKHKHLFPRLGTEIHIPRSIIFADWAIPDLLREIIWIPNKLHDVLMALQPLWALASFQFPDQFTIGRTLWTSDRPVARPLPKYRTTQTQNTHIYKPNIDALSGIRTIDHSVQASEDSSCVRPLGYRDRQLRDYTS